MAMQITGHPKDGIRKLNLRFRVDDPRYADIERLRAQLKYHQGTGVLLDAMVLGARLMLEQADIRSTEPELTPSARPSGIERVSSGSALAPATAVSKPGLSERHSQPVIRSFSEGTSKQFAQYGDMD